MQVITARNIPTKTISDLPGKSILWQFPLLSIVPTSHAYIKQFRWTFPTPFQAHDDVSLRTRSTGCLARTDVTCLRHGNPPIHRSLCMASCSGQSVAMRACICARPVLWRGPWPLRGNARSSLARQLYRFDQTSPCWRRPRSLNNIWSLGSSTVQESRVVRSNETASTQYPVS